MEPGNLDRAIQNLGLVAKRPTNEDAERKSFGPLSAGRISAFRNAISVILFISTLTEYLRGICTRCHTLSDISSPASLSEIGLIFKERGADDHENPYLKALSNSDTRKYSKPIEGTLIDPSCRSSRQEETSHKVLACPGLSTPTFRRS